uniref:Uncharacterized protein n=1 Tax=Anopheles arabiensis TaxID=7173 RepID=A0A182I9P5_ANOAR
MFDANLCLTYVKQLADQMMARRELFLADIPELRQQRLLGEQQQGFAGRDQIPPARSALDASLDQMQQKLSQRFEIIDEYLLEMETLCEGIKSRPLFDQRSALDASLEQMQQKLSQRHEIIDEYLLEMETLCEERELVEFRSYLDHLKAKKMQRLEDIGNLRRETKKLKKRPPGKEQQRLLKARKFPPTRENMHELRMLHEE